VDLRAPLSAFGRYDLLEKIGEGTASEVFVARSDGFEGLFRSSALKRMKADLCSDVVLVSRFIEEARLAVRVEHPGTVGVDDFGRVGGVYFIAYELVDGVSVEELIAKVTARGLMIDPRAAAYILRAVALALHAVHKTKGADGKPLGLVHADLQPKNVLVSRDGKVKLRGFAAPSLFQGESAAVFFEALGPAGVAHQAPEVLAGALPTPRSDMWSLGALAFELLTGEQLFAPTTKIEDLVNAVRSVPIAPPSSRFAGVPSVLDAIVDEALVRVPERRAADAGAWAASLDDYLEGAGYDEAKFLRTLVDLDGDDARGSAPGRQSTKVQRFTKRSAAPAPVDLAEPSTQQITSGGMPHPAAALASTVRQASRVHLVEQLHKDPGPWGLVRLAERTVDDGRADDATALFRAAAIVFASRGLLAHALCAHDGARGALSSDDNKLDLLRLAELGEGNLALRQTELRRVGGLAWLEALRAQTDGLDAPISNAPSTPFLSALPPEAFARLGQFARVRRAPAGSYVLREGEPGDSLFAVGEGRLVVTCTPSTIEPGEADVESDEAEERTDPGIGARRLSGVVVAAGLESELKDLDAGRAQGLELVDPSQSRVFLSALTAGDLFGEFSFLTGRPRSASVEAVTTCRIVEITRAAVGGLLDQHLELRDAIEAFYKERVLEWMLAKNEVFSLLEPEARRALLSQCGVYDIPAGKVVVREGELHDAMYFIKRGEVEVTTNDAGLEVFINKLGAGEFFGEIAALEGGPRRANVRAVTDLEVFRITRSDLQHVLADAPDVKAKLARAMKARSEEIRRRIAEQRSVLGST
jgi:CRP-like cAMP-binding protein/serine/threonine protein kinase